MSIGIPNDCIQVMPILGGVAVHVRISVDRSIDGKHYVIHCPSLELATQGKTEKEAKENIVDAVGLFLETCVEDNILDVQLLMRGYQKTQMDISISANYEGTQLQNLQDTSFTPTQITFTTMVSTGAKSNDKEYKYVYS